jgi:cysteamine dioxygenase
MDDYNRREFLRTTVPGYLGLVLALPGLTAMATRANAHQGRLARDCKINWDAFLEGVAKEAAKQHLDHWDEPAYLRKVETLAGRLCLHDPALVEAFEKARSGIGNGRIDFDRLENREDFQISYLQFEKGEAIPHHDHPGMTGVLLCATGELVTENYTLLYEELPADCVEEDESGEEGVEQEARPGRVLLKSAGTTVLRKGQTASLTSKQRNIHRVAAGELSQIIDVFAPPYTKERIADSKWFTVDEEPYQGREGVFEAEES